MQTFQDFVNENWASQAKAKLAGLGSSIAGDKQGAAVKQAQSLVKSSNLHGIFDKFKQDLIELTKSSSELEFNKKFPEQAKFITNIAANLEVLKSGNVGAPAAPEQQPNVATQKGAASQARRQARQAADQQNQDIARQQAQQQQPAVQTASVHVNDNDMINEAYSSVQEAPGDKARAKWAGTKAKLGNIAKTLTGRGGDVVNALKATIDNRIESFKKQFQTGLGKLQADLGALGLGEDSPAIQAINNSMGSAEQIPEPTPDQVQAATPEEEPTPDEPEASPEEEPAAENEPVRPELAYKEWLQQNNIPSGANGAQFQEFLKTLPMYKNDRNFRFSKLKGLSKMSNLNAKVPKEIRAQTFAELKLDYPQYFV
tara:strand:- start:51 stop:1163 length:1113 start_codon:yes stop_codon:yes gene_type:complete